MRRIIISGALVIAVSSPATATIIHVPGDYVTIQEGINACVENDTVIVADGIYFENVVINTPISLIGENRDGVVIDGSDSGDVIFVDTPDVYISNLTVRNSGGDYYDSGIELAFLRLRYPSVGSITIIESHVTMSDGVAVVKE